MFVRKGGNMLDAWSSLCCHCLSASMLPPFQHMLKQCWIILSSMSLEMEGMNTQSLYGSISNALLCKMLSNALHACFAALG